MISAERASRQTYLKRDYIKRVEYEAINKNSVMFILHFMKMHFSVLSPTKQLTGKERVKYINRSNRSTCE